MERVVVEYLANALWQVPALALGAWVLLRMWKAGPAAQHRVWLAVLGLGLLLPLRGWVQVGNAIADRPATATSIGRETAGPSTPFDAKSASNSAQDDITETRRLWRNEGAEAGSAWADFVEQGATSIAAATSLHRVSVSAVAARWVAGLWLLIALWGLLWIAGAWRVARRLVAGSREIALGERESAALRECSRRMGVSPPEVRESDEIAGPVVVGWLAPVLLWPEGFARCSEDELRAALFHELAHVRRRDYGMNLLCEAAALPLKWHPAAHGVERRIRATREMACDAMAAEAMESEMVYAECLVRLARKILGGGLAAEALSGSVAVGLFNGNVMEERVMRLMRGRTAMSLRARVVRGAAGAAAMLAAMALAGMFHVVPAMAQVAAVADSQVVPVLPVTPVMPVSKVLPVAPAMPVAPVLPVAKVLPIAPAMPVAVVMPVAPVMPVAAVMPVVPVMPVAPVLPVVSVPAQVAAPVKPKPVPAVLPAPPQVPEPVVILDGKARALTPAERARIEKQLEEAQKRIAEATAKIDSPEFRKQMEDAQTAALRAQTMLNSAEFKRQMADAQRQVAQATAKMNSPEFRKKIQAEIDAAAKMNSAEFKQQMADAQKQIAEATARLNSPEFKRQIEEAAQAAAKVNSAEFQKQMADAQKQIADAMAKMKAEQEKGAAK